MRFLPFLLLLSLFGVGCISPLSNEPVLIDNTCQVGGCGGEICGEAGKDPLVSTCEWAAHYECYKHLKTCKRQADGKCGWNPSEVARQQQCVDKKEYPPLVTP